MFGDIVGIMVEAAGTGYQGLRVKPVEGGIKIGSETHVNLLI